MPGASSFEDWIAQQVQRGASALAPTPAPAPSYEDAFAAFLKQSAPRPVPDLGGMASDAFAQAMRTNPADITIEPNVPSDLGLPSPTGYDAFAASVSRASQRPAPPDLAAASEAAGAVARPAPTDPADIVRDPGAAEVRAVKAAEYAPPGPAPAPVVAAAPTLPAPPPEAPPPTLPPPPAGYDAFAASIDRATQPFGRGVVPDLAAASDAAGAVVRDPATGEARLGVNPADITIEPNMVGDVNLADITLESEDQANNGGVLYADPANHAAVQADALAQLNAAHPPQAAAGLALRTSPPPGAEFATPTLPAPSSTIDDIQIEQPDYALENDLARLAKSETFAPDRDPTPEGRAAEQAFERAMASDKRIREDAARLNAMDPFERAAEMERRKRAQEVERQRLELDAMEQDNAERAANIKRREMATLRAQADMNDVRQRAAAMSDRSPFESWWSDRSTPQKFAGFIAAIASGLGNLNGPNSALNMFVQTAEADAAQKWKKLETQRGLAQDALAAAGDDFKEREAIRLASLQQMQRGIEAQLAQLDPEGTAAMRLSEVQQGIAARIQQAQDAAAKEAFDRADKMIARDQEQQKIDDARAKWQAEENRRNRAAASGRTGSGWGDKDVHSGVEWADHIDPQGKFKLREALGDKQLSGKDVKFILDQQKGLQQASVEETRQTSVEQQTVQGKKQFDVDHRLTFDGKPLYVYDDNGNIVIDPVTKEPQVLVVASGDRPAMQKKLANAVTVMHLLDEAKAIRAGASAVDLANPKSKVSQQLDTIATNVQLAMKDGTQGMSSDADGRNLAASAGVSDLRSMFNQDAAIDAGRRILTNKVNNDLHNEFAYNGPPIIIPNSHAGAPPHKDENVARASARYKPAVSFLWGDSATRQTFHARSRIDAGEASDEDYAKAASPSARAGIDEMAAAVARGDADASDQATNLIDVATDGSDAAGRGLAALEFWKLYKAGNPAAVAVYGSLDRGKQAAVIASLPPRHGAAAVDDLIGRAREDLERTVVRARGARRAAARGQQ